MKELTQREIEALALAADGGTHKGIGRSMNIERGTVSKHLERARLKLHAMSTAHAVAIAIRAGVID